MFLLRIFQATRTRSSGRELVPCAAFAMNFFALDFLYVLLLGSFRRRAQDPQVGNSYRVPRSRRMFAFNFLYVILLGSFRRRAQDPQVGNSYRVTRLVYAPKISVFVSVNTFRTPLRVCRPVAIKYQTPLGISGTCFPRTAGNNQNRYSTF